MARGFADDVGDMDGIDDVDDKRGGDAAVEHDLSFYSFFLFILCLLDAWFLKVGCVVMDDG